MYIFNVDTGTLHIEGYCTYISTKGSNVKLFETEREARDYAGENIHMCKVCQKIREKKLKERE